MSPKPMTTKHDDRDHDIWMRCFTAAITGLLAGSQGAEPRPEYLVSVCCGIADEALQEESRRRRESKH